VNQDPLLRVRNLHTHFESRSTVVRAVDGVSFDLSRGEVLGVVGESGCGKTATALSLTRLLPAAGRVVAGEIIFDGQDLLRLSTRGMRELRGSKIGFVPQDPMTSLNPLLTVGDQLTEIGRTKLDMSRRAASAHALGLLDRVGIANAKTRMRQYPHQLSGGMRQRVLIAMAIACHPTLLIADEPTTALDVTIQAQILDLIRELKVGELEATSVILITHDLGIAASMCDTVMVMYGGQVVERAGVDDFFARPRMPYSWGLMEALPSVDGPQSEGSQRLRVIEGSPPRLNRGFSGCRFVERCAYRKEICAEQEPMLLDRDGNQRTARCWGTQEGGWIDDRA
jgi:oligopeptide/dipeptide ABC transporter ATP-binding protein